MVTFVAIILTLFLSIAAGIILGLILLTLVLFYVVLIGIFTTVPVTQYVYINDTVTFECASETSIYFIAGGLIQHSQSSVTLPNGGMMISINLTATKDSNETNVTCYTVSGNATKTAYLYVQGNNQHIFILLMFVHIPQVLLIVSVV